MHGTFATLVFAIAMPLVPDGMQDYLRQSGEPPAEYLLSKLNDHRIVVVGENHWQRNDAQLVAGLAFELRRLEVALAMEVFRASSQDDIDALIFAREWNQALANRIMRAGAWPYVQYRDILHQAWQANRIGGPPFMKVIALGPPEDWRKQGIRYDAFMAERVRTYATDEKHRVLVYCGMHHAFTHYLQVERLRKGRATSSGASSGRMCFSSRCTSPGDAVRKTIRSRRCARRWAAPSTVRPCETAERRWASTSSARRSPRPSSQPKASTPRLIRSFAWSISWTATSGRRPSTTREWWS